MTVARGAERGGPQIRRPTEGPSVQLQEILAEKEPPSQNTNTNQLQVENVNNLIFKYDVN